jgi:hypothetical protein
MADLAAAERPESYAAQTVPTMKETDQRFAFFAHFCRLPTALFFPVIGQRAGTRPARAADFGSARLLQPLGPWPEAIS